MNWIGSRWWKFDFHNHTPASDDYGKVNRPGFPGVLIHLKYEKNRDDIGLFGI